MRRKFPLLLALLLITVLFGNAGAVVAATEKKQDLSVDTYFENGTVYTVDAQDSVAQALAVKDGKIIFVGSAVDGAPYKAAAKEVVDLNGGMLLPGFIDGHIHTATMEFFNFNLVGVTDVDEMLKIIEDAVKANPDRASYTGYGYMTSVFEGDELQNGPRKERLDAISPDKSLFIWSFDGHAAWLNSKCFEKIGITKDTESTPGGVIVKDPATGELWGTLKDSAMSMLPEFDLPMDKMTAALNGFHSDLNSLGYTSIMVLPGNGFFPIPWDAYVQLEKDNQLTMRMRGAGIITSWEPEQSLVALKKLQDTYQSELVALTSAKFFSDGVMDSETAYLLEPYSDNPDNMGDAAWEQDALNKAMTGVNQLGVQVHAHAIGDGAVRMVLDAMEYAGNNVTKGDYRNAITHLQLVSPQDIPRFKELGVIAVVQPYWHYREPQYWEAIEHPALGDRAYKEYPMQSFLKNGVVVAYASDYPVTIPPNPFLAMEISVTRNMADGTEYGLPDITDMDDPRYLLWPEERVSVKDAIRGFTANAAYAMFSEDVTGTLEVGKSADMIVIDQNLLTINPLAISDTKVLKTYLRGQKVFDAAE